MRLFPLVVPLLFVILTLSLSATPAHASDCQFVLGFKAAVDRLGIDLTGNCLENEYPTAAGAQQRTENGTLYWDRKENYVYYIVNADPTPTPRPQPTPTPAPLIDSRMHDVFALLQTTGTGRVVYQWFVESGAGAEFFNLRDPAWGNHPRISGMYYPQSHLVRVDVSLKDNTPLAASWFVHEAMHAISRYNVETEEDCYVEEATAFTWQAMFWWDLYGGEASGVSESLDRDVERYLQGTIGERVRSSEVYQEHCGQWPSAQPTPVPTHIQSRTGCELWQVENWVWQRLKAQGIPDAFVDRLVARMQPNIAYAVALEAQYTAASRAFPDWNGNPVISSLRFCQLVASSSGYRNLAAGRVGTESW